MTGGRTGPSLLDRSRTAAISSVSGPTWPLLPVRPMMTGTASLTATLRRVLLLVAVATLVLAGCATPPEPPEPPPQPEELPREAPPAARETLGEAPSGVTEASSGEAPGAPASGAAEPAGDQSAAEAAATEGAPAGDPAGELGDRFEQSLGEFDAVLLSEQAKIAEQRRRGVESAPPVGPGGRPGGPDVAAGTGAPGTAATGESAPSGPGTSPDADGGGSSGGSVGAGSGPGIEVPPDVGTGADDDIVARQLREAAMKEQDPELREKLWDEYRKYKQGTQR